MQIEVIGRMPGERMDRRLFCRIPERQLGGAVQVLAIAGEGVIFDKAEAIDRAVRFRFYSKLTGRGALKPLIRITMPG